MHFLLLPILCRAAFHCRIIFIATHHLDAFSWLMSASLWCIVLRVVMLRTWRCRICCTNLVRCKDYPSFQPFIEQPWLWTNRMVVRSIPTLYVHGSPLKLTGNTYLPQICFNPLSCSRVSTPLWERYVPAMDERVSTVLYTPCVAN